MTKINTEKASMDTQSLKRLRDSGIISRVEYYSGVAMIHEDLKNQARTIVLENGYSPKAQADYMYFEKEFNRFKVKEYQAKQASAEQAYENELKQLQKQHS